MNLEFLYFIGFIILSCIIGLAIYFIRISTREQSEPSNQTFIDNYMPQYSDGFSFGVVNSIQSSATTTKISFYPRDQDLIKIANSKEDEVVKPQIIYILNKNVDYKPAGSWSARRNRLRTFPPLIEEIPECFKDEEWLVKKVVENEVSSKKDTQWRKIVSSQSELQEDELPMRMAERHLENMKESQTINKGTPAPEAK